MPLCNGPELCLYIRVVWEWNGLCSQPANGTTRTLRCFAPIPRNAIRKRALARMNISEEQWDSIQVKTLKQFWDVTGSFPSPFLAFQLLG